MDLGEEPSICISDGGSDCYVMLTDFHIIILTGLVGVTHHIGQNVKVGSNYTGPQG